MLKEKLEKSMTEDQGPEIPPGNPEEGLTPSANERFKWYIIHAYSGFERKVRESLESRITAFGLQNKIGRIMIPTEPVTELRNGKKYTIERVFLPGYVLVEMELDNDLWHVIKNTPRVTGFVGSGVNPVPLKQEEVDVLLGRMAATQGTTRHAIDVAAGDSVVIVDGPFKDLDGKVGEVDESRGKVKVLVAMFGRETPVELDFLQIKRI